MMVLGLVGVMALVLSGCETTEGYRQHLGLWEGKSTDTLLIEWGVPNDKATLSDGAELWVYRKTKEATTGGFWTTRPEFRTEVYVVNGKRATRQVSYDVSFYEPPVTTISRCETRFIIKDNMIKSATFEGNGCVAEEIKKDPVATPPQ
jgi:hypothetical protein